MINKSEISLPIEGIAIMAHQANRQYCDLLGDYSQKDWYECEDWQRDSAIKGVEFVLNNPECTPEDTHNSWLEVKKENGWKYGDVKDAVKKEHPCFVPYEKLETKQKLKDKLFRNIVLTFFL